jgi:hypothetical protein
MNIATVRVERQSIEAADMHGQHEPQPKSYREVEEAGCAGVARIDRVVGLARTGPTHPGPQAGHPSC